MNRRQLVAAVAVRIGDEQAADVALTVLCETVMATVARGERVRLDGFGTFSRVRRPPALGAPATYVPRFDPADEFRA